ncbi:MAG TPA: nuclear transport factor 2 family protein [Gemmataceae bacterium]|nr:nuclear transport factor 2 family protein [Gemmataceae bacterium]
MPETSDNEAVIAAMQRINRAWLDRRPREMVGLVHPDVTIVVPGFAGRVTGREAFIAGFQDFCNQAIVHEFRESDQQVDVAGNAGVVSFVYEMVYERGGTRYRAIGRDLWVFSRHNGEWLAVWRTMLDQSEQEV